MAALFAGLLVSFTPHTLVAQLTTGTVEGVVRDSTGHPEAGLVIVAIGSLSASRWSTKSRLHGEFQLVLPHGDYKIAPEFATGPGPAIQVHVFARQVTHASLTLAADLRSGVWTRATAPKVSHAPGLWSTSPASDGFAEPYSLGGILLTEEPATITDPLDFTGAQNTRIPLLSHRSFSWTATTFSLEGMNATDPYQPGHPIVFPDVQALDEITVESPRDSEAPGASGVEIGLFVQTPRRNWHGELSSVGTAAALASSNLPVPAYRNILQQAQQYTWFTRDRVDFGGPLGRRADMYFSGTGQWASETVPVAPKGQNQNSRLLFGTFGTRYQLTPRDQVEFLLTGSRINLSNWGEPVGLEALTGWRAMPAYDSPYGFSGLPEVDHLVSSKLDGHGSFPSASALAFSS